MRKIILLISAFFCSIFSYAQKIEKELKVEKDGFCWYLVSVITNQGDVTWGVQDKNGDYIITPDIMLPFYASHDGGYFWTRSNNRRKIYTKEGHLAIEYDNSSEKVSYHKADDGNIWLEIHKDGKAGAKDIDGNWLIEMNTRYNDYLNYYNKKWVAQNKGSYFDIRQGFNPKEPEENPISNTDESDETISNQFWYDEYRLFKMDSEGSAILSSEREIKARGGNIFEVKFIFNKDSSTPLTVKLYEKDKNHKILKSEHLGSISRKSLKNIGYDSEGYLTLILQTNMLKITKDGTIIVRKFNKDRSFTNCSSRLFSSDDPFYIIEYSVLEDNIGEIFK